MDLFRILSAKQPLRECLEILSAKTDLYSIVSLPFLPIVVYTVSEVICVNMISVSECARKWGVAERTVRNYVSVSQIQEREKRKQKQKHGAIHYTSSGVMFR